MSASGIPEYPAPLCGHQIKAPAEAPWLRCASWLALGMSLAILVGYLVSGVQLFADGGFFCFLTGDPWSFHFANIPARAFAFLVTIVPPFLAALRLPAESYSLPLRYVREHGATGDETSPGQAGNPQTRTRQP